MKTRILSFVLVLLLLLPSLFACGGEGDGETTAPATQGGNKDSVTTEQPSANTIPEEGFGGEELVINVSVAINAAQTFGAADIYHRGPKTYAEAADEVQQMIFNRNKKLADELKVKVTWQETNQTVGLSQAVLEKFVQNNPDNSPDIFINDIYDMTHAMLTGSLRNLVGGKENYLDFTAPGWYQGYMLGTTIDQNKVYIMAGDYFLDLLRYSFVTYVNRGVFEAKVSSLFTVSELYEYVKDGWWDYYVMQQCVEMAADIDGGALRGEEDEEDASLGLVARNLLERALTWSSGLSVVEWTDEKGRMDPELKCIGTPRITTDYSGFKSLHDNFYDLFRAEGTLYLNLSGDASVRVVTLFLEGNTLFFVTMLGEMESAQMRESQLQKGILPLPKYDCDEQDSYYTLVHDQAEVGCILANARHFGPATAYMQRANISSADIQVEYFEQSLKLRYNEDLDTQAMLDLVKAGITDPFESLIARLVVIGGQYLPGAPYNSKEEIFWIIADDAKKGTETFVSNWDSHRDGWVQNLEHLVGIFERLK